MDCSTLNDVIGTTEDALAHLEELDAAGLRGSAGPTTLSHTEQPPWPPVDISIEAVALLSNKVAYLQNQCNAINRLPPQILAHILNFSRHRTRQSPVRGGVAPYEPYIFNWASVLRVCRHWRNIAVSTPILWSTIPIVPKASPFLVNMFMARASPEPLTILCSIEEGDGSSISSNSVQVLQRLRRCLSTVHDNLLGDPSIRIRHFIVEPMFPVWELERINAVSQSLGRQMQSARGSVAGCQIFLPPVGPDIDNASPDGTHRKGYLHRLITHPTMFSSRSQFDLHGHSVTYFIQRCRASTLSNASTHPRLTSLRLNNITHKGPASEGPQKSFGQHMLENLLITLEACRGTLEELSLVAVYPIDNPSGPSSSTTTSKSDAPRRTVVALPNLKYLEIGAWPSSTRVIHFLFHIEMPPNAGRCIWGDELKHLSALLFKGLSMGEHTTPVPYPSISRVVMSSVPGPEMVSFSHADGSHRTLILQGSFDVDHYLPLFRDNAPTFQDVEELVLTPILLPPETASEWGSLFDYLPNVRRLKLVDAESGALLQSLLLQNCSGRAEELLLPLLDSIEIIYSTTVPPQIQPQLSSSTGLSFTLPADATSLLGRPFETTPGTTVLLLSQLAQERRTCRLALPVKNIVLGFGWRSQGWIVQNKSFALFLVKLINDQIRPHLRNYLPDDILVTTLDKDNALEDVAESLTSHGISVVGMRRDLGEERQHRALELPGFARLPERGIRWQDGEPKPSDCWEMVRRELEAVWPETMGAWFPEARPKFSKWARGCRG